MHKRETELDILRILAMLAVIFTHASGIETGNARPAWTHIFLLATVTWHVPVYVMLSGRFFLDPERQMPVSKLIKAIGRLALAFAAWNVVYQLWYVFSDTYTGLNWKGILSQVLIGPYHFWYLFMLVGLYAITPFLRQIVQNKRLTEYFLVLFLCFSFLTEYGPKTPLIGSALDWIVAKINFHFAIGYTGYYVLGYYLKKYPLSGKKEITLYALGILMLLLTGAATVWNTVRGVEGKEWFSKYLMPNVILEAAAIYSFFVNRVSRITVGEKTKKWITRLSEYSFGVYLIHALVLEVMTVVLKNAAPGNWFVAIGVFVLLTFVVSNLMVCLIRKIPYAGKKLT